MRHSGERVACQFGAMQLDTSPAIVYMLRFSSVRPGSKPARWKDIYIDGRAFTPSENLSLTNSTQMALESIVVRLARSDVEAMQSRPIRVSVLGESGSFDFDVARPIAAGFLIRCNEVLKQDAASDPRFAPIR